MDLTQDDSAARIALIRAHLPLAEVPGLPGLVHHAARPEARVSRLAEKLGTTAEDLAPFWAWLWPGGAGLIHYIRAHPETVQGRVVVDLGAGSGLLAVEAMRHGARRAVCVDPDPMARAACRANAAANGVEVEVAAAIDLAGLDAVELLLAGDVFYDPEVAQASAALLNAAKARGAEVLVGDIGRHCLPKAGLTERAAYEVRDVGDAPSQPPWRVRVMDWPAVPPQLPR
ncbi:ribosomal protein L11 methyltransferase [Pseudooceanicola nanhaiensis]|jgi:predicted nicotinamide N-methyase|uniref:Ribosomal protein L11 methyltransferase n=1 Tax=Pseudooceanicola nanhaiensis TaxID=375761 RepID=A0A917T537_9RHOB|nr:50S ribosomal protein L11 methyltransferase [Pseudooceanicola nanhaiensis]GGM09662.1 ribosomal protein L11 methyltransferase [Pseudooceanicola nanhaiensis]